jgi:hypothetical protein
MQQLRVHQPAQELTHVFDRAAWVRPAEISKEAGYRTGIASVPGLPQLRRDACFPP